MASILINADDFGLTDGVCRSIAELFDCGGISNTSAMICVDGAGKRIKDYLPTSHRQFVGVHLQLTPENYHGTPISDPKEIPTLVDVSGKFKPKDHCDWINPDEVALEWQRQILETADALGRMPSHLDSHHGVHRKSDLIPIYLGLASKYGLAVRGGTASQQIDSSSCGVRASKLCTSDWTGKNGTVESFKQMVHDALSLVGDGILEICTHPGFSDEALIHASSWNTVRETDYKVLRSLAEEGWFKEQGILFTHF